jgi:hypothetical protein
VRVLAPDAPPRTAALGFEAIDRRSLLLGAGSAIIVGALAASQGGYFASAWGWGAVLLLVPTALAWTLDGATAPTGWRLAIVGTVVALAGWIALSISWSTVPWATVLEVERAILYVAAALAAATFIRPRRIGGLVGGVTVAIAVIAAYSLATRLFPNRLGVFEPLGVYRLADPVGYWNALALFVAIGLLLTLMLVARGERLLVRCASAAVVPMLISTFYFTFGRSAWISLGVGLAAALVVDPRRIQLTAVLLTIAPTATAAVLICAHARGLTHTAVALALAVHDGHRTAVAIILLAAAAAAVEALRSLVAASVRFGDRLRIAFGVVCLVAVVAAGAGAVGHAGGPVKLVKRAKSTFVAKPVPQATSTSVAKDVQQANLNKRLFSFSSNGRVDLWHAAWHDHRAHPWLGAGAGTYERYWLRHRPNQLNVVDAHSLYLESLAELGPVGLVLVVSLIGIGLAACVRARRSPFVPGIAAAIVAYAVHAGADWDWEVTVLGVVVIGLATAAVAAGESPHPRRLLPPVAVRAAATTTAAVLAVLASAGLAGNQAAAASDDAIDAGRWAAAASDARKAQRWMPWSPQPWLLLANAELGAGDVAAARASFAHALRKDPGNWNTWLDAARAATGPARARDLRIATRLNPRSAEIADFRSAVKGGR